MENQTPKSIASATSTVRDHSPYCEATGPIVHEGFVAARVRAIQAKYEGNPPSLSHSPLIPCPIPRWLQITDSFTTPQSTSYGRRRISQKHSTYTDSATALTHSPRYQPSHIGNAVQRKEMDSAANCPSVGAKFQGSTMISSPKPIFPTAGPSYEGWPFSDNDEGSRVNSPHLGSNLHPLPSVADKLVSLVDRGWVGCDVFGKAYSDHHTSDTYALSENGHNQTTNEKQLYWGKTYQGAVPDRRYLYPDQRTSVHCEDQENKVKEPRSPQGTVSRSREHDFQSMQGRKSTLNQDRKAHACIDSSEVDRSQVSDTESGWPTDGIQANGQRHHRQFTECHSHHSENEKLSLSQEIDRHLSQWENTRGVAGEVEHIGSTDQQGDDQLKRLSPAPTAENQHPTKADVQRSQELAQSSASWFSKLPGFKLVLKDKYPTIQGPSRRTSEPVMKVAGLQHHLQQRNEIEHQQTPNPAEETALKGNGRLLTRNEEEHSLNRADAANRHAQSGLGRDSSLNVCTNEESLSLSDSPPIDRVSHPSRSPSRYSQLTLPFLPPDGNVQRRSQPELKYEKRPESPSASSQPKAEPSSSSFIDPKVKDARDTQETQPESFDSERISRGTYTGSTHSGPRETMFHRLKASANANANDQQVKSMEKSAQWEVAGNGRGIKRVQVIVSLDGADDLMIDARLLAAPNNEADLQLEDMEDLDCGHLSDCSDPEFF